MEPDVLRDYYVLNKLYKELYFWKLTGFFENKLIELIAKGTIHENI